MNDTRTQVRTVLRQVRTALVTIMGLSLPIGAQAPYRPLTVITVCDVIANPLAFNAKTVAVLGRYRSTSHGSAISEDDCPKPLRTGNYTWPNAISLENKPAQGPVPPGGLLVLDEESLARALARVAATTKLGTTHEYGGKGSWQLDDPQRVIRMESSWHEVPADWTVIYGRIGSRANIYPPGAISSSPFGNGFGHLGGLPAEIVCRPEYVKRHVGVREK